MKKVVFLMREKSDSIPNEYSAAIVWWYDILENMGYDVMYYDYNNFVFENFYSEMKSYKPDYIIHACYEAIHTEFIKLKEISKVFIIQSDDDYRFDSYAKLWIPFVDGVISFCGDRLQMKKLYNDYGLKDEKLLHGYWSFNPNTMIYDDVVDKKDSMTHMGSLYGNRHQIINGFISKNIKVDVHNNIPYSDFKNLTSRSKFTLCLTLAATQNMRQLKGRLFELPSLSVLVSEPFPNMESYYDLDKEIIVFQSISDAVERMNRLFKDKNEYTKMFNAGKKRVLSEHTCYHVWDKYILPKMDGDYKSKNVAEILKTVHGINI